MYYHVRKEGIEWDFFVDRMGPYHGIFLSQYFVPLPNEQSKGNLSSIPF